MHPTQAQFLLEFLLPQLLSEQSVTRKIIAAVPTSAGTYQPHPKAMTAFQLARHIAICELWFLDAICNGRFDDIAPPALTTCPQIAHWYAENTTQRIRLIQQLAPEQLAQPIDYIGLRNDPAVAYLNFALRHTVHHRGQLSTYLRALDAHVPAIYVESADEPYTGDGSETTPPPAF